MKALSLINMGVLVLLLGAVAPTYAQEEKQEEAKPAAKQEEAHAQQSQGQYAKNGQKDSRGHEYSCLLYTSRCV